MFFNIIEVIFDFGSLTLIVLNKIANGSIELRNENAVIMQDHTRNLYYSDFNITNLKLGTE